MYGASQQKAALKGSPKQLEKLGTGDPKLIWKDIISTRF